MRVRRADGCSSDLKQLQKTYRSAGQDIIYFERLLQKDITHGHNEFSGLKLRRGEEQAHIFKAWVPCATLQSKRKGIRYVYERITGSDGYEYSVGLTIYVHQQGDDESTIRKRIRQRQESFDLSNLNELFTPDLESDD
jgi:hypothetical protein